MSGGGTNETQASVFEWCEEHYAGEDARRKVLNLIEEAVELGLVLGVDVASLESTVRLTAEKSNDPVGDPDCIRKEVGDVQLSVLNLAQELDVDAQAALDEVMAKNRLKSVEESQERSARKVRLGIA